MDLDKISNIEFYSLGQVYYPVENQEKNEMSEIKTGTDDVIIDTIQIIPLKIAAISNSGNFTIKNKKFCLKFNCLGEENKIQNTLNSFKEEKKHLRYEFKRIKIVKCTLMIYFKEDDINYIFHESEYKKIINTESNPTIYIYLKKFTYDCEIETKLYNNYVYYLLPFFPFKNVKNEKSNLKFLDLIISFKIPTENLIDLLIEYNNKFIEVNKITTISEELNASYELDKDDFNFSLETDNLDCTWCLLSLVSENFITYYTLITFLIKYEQKINEIIKKDPFIFILSIKEILKEKNTLSKKHTKFLNSDIFYKYVHDFCEITQLTKKQIIEYEKIKSIYTENINRKRYFMYEMIIDPISCYFKIPYKSNGKYIYIKNLTDEFDEDPQENINPIKPYDLIYVNFKFNNRRKGRIKINNDIFDCYILGIIESNFVFGESEYKFLGASGDDIKNQKCWFINKNKSIDNIINHLNIRTKGDYSKLFSLLFSNVIAYLKLKYNTVKYLNNIENSNKNSNNINYIEDNEINDNDSEDNDNEEEENKEYEIKDDKEKKEKSKNSNKKNNSIEKFNNNNDNKKIKIKYIFDTGCGVISKGLKNDIYQKCKIHSYSSMCSIINGYYGNFSIYDSQKLNLKNRMIVRENMNIGIDGNEVEKDNILFILNKFCFTEGWANLEVIKTLYQLSINKSEFENFIQNNINSSFNLTNEKSILDNIQIYKIRNYFEKLLNKKFKLACNFNEFNFSLSIKQAINNYHNKILKNQCTIKIEDSAILNGVIDEYGIFSEYFKNEKDVMKNNDKVIDMNLVILILNNNKYENVCVKGKGIIFKVKSNNIYSFNPICVVNFFNIENFKKCGNPIIIEKLNKIKKLTNVIIFPKFSRNFFNKLNVDNISQQEFFISWNKTLLKNIKIKKCEKEMEDNKNENENNISYEERRIDFIYSIKKKNSIFYDCKIDSIKKYFNSNNEYFIENYNQLRKLNKLFATKNLSTFIDYKNLTKSLCDKNNIKKNLNELELLYLEYIPKCVYVVSNIANTIKELMYYSNTNNLFDLIIGNYHDNICSKKHFEDVSYIDDIFTKCIDNNFIKLVKYFYDIIKKNKTNNKDALVAYYDRINIIAVIIYNICYSTKMSLIIKNYKENIKRFLNHNIMTDKERLLNNKNIYNIYIEDNDDYEYNCLGEDGYKLYEEDKLIDDNRVYENENIIEFVKDDELSDDDFEYENFFTNFNLIGSNNLEIEKFYIPQLLVSNTLFKLMDCTSN